MQCNCKYNISIVSSCVCPVNKILAAVTYLLGSRNVEECFKHLAHVNLEYFYPDQVCPGLVTISRLQNKMEGETEVLSNAISGILRPSHCVADNVSFLI